MYLKLGVENEAKTASQSHITDNQTSLDPSRQTVEVNNWHQESYSMFYLFIFREEICR